METMGIVLIIKSLCAIFVIGSFLLCRSSASPIRSDHFSKAVMKTKPEVKAEFIIAESFHSVTLCASKCIMKHNFECTGFQVLLKKCMLFGTTIETESAVTNPVDKSEICYVRGK